MPYLIDGNNLAGKLHLLGQPGFDQTLVSLLNDYFAPRNQHAMIVFDSNDPLGDRFSDDSITVIYTPRDAVYANADDKIIELMENEKRPEEWVVVSDDMRIIEAARHLDIEVVLASEFAHQFMPEAEIDDEEEITETEADDITAQLMEEWET